MEEYLHKIFEAERRKLKWSKKKFYRALQDAWEKVLEQHLEVQ